MSKVLAIATLICTFIASGAQAHGFGHHCGGFGVPIFNSYNSYSGSYHHRTYEYSSQPRQLTKKSSETNTAKVDANDHAESENSSIAVASSDVAQTKPLATAVKTAAAEPANLGCKEFFPAVGMTLSVPCQ
jgi:hypothetical protein